MDRLQGYLGYVFQNPDHLRQALSHTSMAKKSYERMEFLGDRILSFVVADMLYDAFPSEEEGALAKRHSAIV
jgi:ribonuclease-3